MGRKEGQGDVEKAKGLPKINYKYQNNALIHKTRMAIPTTNSIIMDAIMHDLADGNRKYTLENAVLSQVPKVLKPKDHN